MLGRGISVAGSSRDKVIRAIDTVISPYSMLGILIRGAYSRNWGYIYMLKARHLMNIDALNKRIEYVNDLALSNQAVHKFNIIKLYSLNAGMFSLVINAMHQVIYALSKRMIPVIDMRRSGIYLEADEEGKVNAWEKYFKQPCGYGLDDIDNGNVYIIRQGPPILRSAVFMQGESYETHFQMWSILFRNYFKLNDECAQYVQQEYTRLIKPGMRVLGVFCRGTDYVKMCPQGCYVQPEADDVINKAKEVITEWGCDYIYVTTEERGIVRRFEKAFPGKVLTASQQYYDELDIDYSQTHVGRAHFNRENDTFLKGLEYLSSIMILSKCTCAVMGVASGSIAALYINGGRFENTYLFNLGIYP